MDKNRKTSIIVGSLFLIALFSDVISVSISEDKSLWVAVMLLDLISGISLIFLGVVVFKILKSYNKRLALSYTIIRIIEGLFFLAMAALLLYQMIAKGVATSTAMLDSLYVYLFVIGGLIFYYLLYKTKLVPLFISIWGILALIILLALNILGVLQTGSVMTAVLASPLAIQEFILALWLIFKGFRTPTSETSSNLTS